MQAISYTQARANLAATMDEVCSDHEQVVITRRSGNPVVMMSLEDFNAWQATAELLDNPVNAQQIAESIQQLDCGDSVEASIDELINMVETGRL